MIVEGDSGGEAPVETSKRSSERARYVLVKNHVREVRETDAVETEVRKRKRKHKEAAVNADSTLEDDVAELRRAYEACRDIMKTMEMKYGERLGLPAPCACRLNKRIRFDDSGAPLDSPALPEDAGGEVCERRPTGREWRAARSEMADTMRYERRGLLQRVKLDPSAHVVFAGSNLHLLPGYCLPHTTRSTV